MRRCRTFAAALLRRPVLAITVAAAAISLWPRDSLPQSAPKADSKGGVSKGDPKQKGPSPGQQDPQTPQLTYGPWSKVCQGQPGGSGKQVCFTGREGRVDPATPVVAAVLIEPEGETRRILRVTLPLGMALQPGTRVIVDQGQPMNAPYVVCVPSGCMADYDVSGEVVGKLKTGQNLHVQGFNASGQAISLMLPLQDFAKALEGPPADPATLGQPPRKPQ